MKPNVKSFLLELLRALVAALSGLLGGAMI